MIPCSSWHRLLMFIGPRARLTVLLFLSLALGANDQPKNSPNQIARFTDIAQKAGLTMKNVFGGLETKKYIIETTGTGVAIFDYDNDGWPDIFLVNGTILESFPAGKAPSNHLYHNNHDGTFTDVTEKAGLGRTGWGQGVCVGDYDNDGWEDLFVTYYGKNVLYHNNGDGTFTDVSERAGVAGSGKAWGTGCAFVDYDRDGHLDLMVANYVDFDLSTAPAPGERPSCLWKGVAATCGPSGLPWAKNTLYHNRGNGTFEDVTSKAHIDQTNGHYAFSVSILDFDDDGWPDIFVACDSTASILYHNNRDGTFSDVAVVAGAAFNEDGRAQAGMGSTVADFNGDGRLDIFKTNFSDDTSTLYRNNGNETFTDFSAPAGPGITTASSSRGLAIGDLWNDGRLSAVISNMNAAPSLLVNQVRSANHWVAIRTVGTKSNRDGIGARIAVKVGARTLVDEVRSGSSYISNNDMRVHFGLGPATKIELLEIRWPSGLVERFDNLTVDAIHTLKEGSGKRVELSPKKP